MAIECGIRKREVLRILQQQFEVNLEYQIPIFLVTATVTESVRSPVKLREWECQLNVTNIMLLNNNNKNNSSNNNTSARHNDTGINFYYQDSII